MIGAIYARKSTEQNGVADEQKSVTRQIEHARAYATGKGWTVGDDQVYVDDGISGAEFAMRPGFVRLMNALKPKPAFQVLVMSEESRLGREAIETAYALKQIVQAGVRVFFYLEDRERTLDSPTDKIMLSLTAFADELEREKARQRTYDAMLRKARAGHVTGGAVFGYDNIEVMVSGLDGHTRRSHVERQINETEAPVIRRIFGLRAQGFGTSRIAKLLNVERMPAPRAQQDRPRAWSPSSVHEVLHRPLYRGEVVWNQTKKRDRWGRHHQTPKPEAEWLRREVPALRIVPEDLWQAAGQVMHRARERYLTSTGGQVFGRRHDRDSQYLLTGFARCAQCGGSFYVKSRSHGSHRAFFYGCTSYHKRGSVVCSNGLEARMEAIDEAVLAAIESRVLRPRIVESAITEVLAEFRPDRIGRQIDDLRRSLRLADDQCRNLAEAIGTRGALPALLDQLDQQEARRQDLRAALAVAETRQAPADATRIESDLRARLGEWQTLMRRNVTEARGVLRALLVRPFAFTPLLDGGRRGYSFAGEVGLGVRRR